MRLALLVVFAFASCRGEVAPQPDDGVFRVAIVGDSVARGAGDESHRGIAGNLPLPVTNLGIDGARTFVVRRLLTEERARTVVRSADAIVVSIGGNDLYGDSIARLLAGAWPSHHRARMLGKVAGVVAAIQRVNPRADIYLLGLYNPYRESPLGAFLDRQVDLWDAELIARFAASPRVTVVRICDLLDRADRISPVDHFHPGAAGYKAIAQRIEAAL